MTKTSSTDCYDFFLTFDSLTYTLPGPRCARYASIHQTPYLFRIQQEGIQRGVTHEMHERWDSSTIQAYIMLSWPLVTHGTLIVSADQRSGSRRQVVQRGGVPAVELHLSGWTRVYKVSEASSSFNPRTAGVGRLSALLRFFANSEKTAARSAAKFAIAIQPTI